MMAMCCEHNESRHKYRDVSLYVDWRWCLDCQCGEYVEVITMSTKPSSDGDEAPEVTPSKLARLFARIHESHKAERAIADTAKGRRIKAQQERKDKEKGK